jgi:outer membrane beta-barrel protein
MSPSLELSALGNEGIVAAVPRSLGGIALASIAAWGCFIAGGGSGGVARADAPPARAEPVGTSAPARPSDAPLPSCLDQTLRDQLGQELRPRGVQKRTFRKDNKLVLHASAGLYGGDLTSSSWIGGGSLGYFFTEDLGIQVQVAVTPLTLDLDAPLEEFFGDNRFDGGLAYVALGNVLWSPIHAKLKLGGGIVHADILLFGGGGRMIHDAVQGLALNAGFALELLVTRALTVRLDARDLMAVQEIAGETRYTNNLVATVGLALYIPTGL